MGKTSFSGKIEFFILMVFTLCASVGISAENGVIFGHVYDVKSGAPLQGVTVRLLEGTSYAVSGMDGYYEIENVENEFSSVASRLDGYRKSKKSYIQKNTETDFYLERLHIDLYSTVTRRIITSEMLDEDPSTDIRDIVNREPGIIDGEYVRGGRYNETGFYFEGFNTNVQDGRDKIYPLSKYDVSSVVFSPSAYENGYADNISGTIKSSEMEYDAGKNFAVRYEGNSVLPKDLNYRYNRLNTNLQGMLNGGLFKYELCFDFNQARNSNPLFLYTPQYLYENDNTGYAYSCELYDYFWDTDSTIDSTGTSMRWTEDSIPYFEAVYETMINPVSGDREIVRHVYVDTVIGNRFTPEYFDTIGTHTPHTAKIEYSVFANIKSQPNSLINTGISIHAYNSAFEQYSNSFIFHPEDFSAKNITSWAVNGYIEKKFGNAANAKISVLHSYYGLSSGPEFKDTIKYMDIYGDTIILSPLQDIDRNWYDRLTNPLYIMDDSVFMNIPPSYSNIGEYSDHPYIYLYPYRVTGLYNAYGKSRQTINEIDAEVSRRMTEINELSVSGGMRRIEAYTNDIFWYDHYSLYDIYAYQSFFSVTDEIKTENTNISISAKIDYFHPKLDESKYISITLYGDTFIASSYNAWYSYPFKEKYDVSYFCGVSHLVTENSSVRFSFETAKQVGDYASLFNGILTNEYYTYNVTAGVPDNDYENSQTAEIGYSFENRNGLYFDICAYNRDMSNIIFLMEPFYRSSYNAPRYYYRNIGNMNSKGVEIKAGFEKRNFALEGNYTYSVSQGSYLLDIVSLPPYYNYWYMAYLPGEPAYVGSDDPNGGEIYNRNTFYKIYDRRHKLDVKSSIRISAWNEGKRDNDVVVAIFNSIISGRPQGEALNNYIRTPMVYMADLKISKNIPVGGATLNVYLSVENIFNAKSVLETYPTDYEIGYDTLDYRIGDIGYDARMDSDEDGIVTIEEKHDFVTAAYEDYYSSATVYTKPRNVSLGVVFSF